MNLVKTAKGNEGQPGKNAYIHIKFSNDGGKSFTSNNGEDAGEWLGQYVDQNAIDSNDVSDYTWVKIVGEDGYTVLLTNENISFVTDQMRKVSETQTYSSDIICMQGIIPRTDFVVGAISPPSPLLASVSGDTITISVSAGETFLYDSGSIDVPITIDSMTFTKKITYSLAKQGQDGQTGKPAIIGQLSNDFIGIPTDSSGNNGVYSNATSTLYIYEGTDDVSSEWDCTASASSGIIGSLSGKTYKITNMTVDAGTVTLTATKSGYANVVKQITVVKTKAGADGQEGAPGEAARTYFLSPSTLVLKRDTNNSYSPSSVIFYAYYRDGQSTSQTAYAGRFLIEETIDNDQYTIAYTSSGNETNHVFTPTNNSIKAIRCTLYASGGTSQMLDIQSIVVLEDIDASAIEEEIEYITSTMTTISSTVDAINNQITNMVTQSDITTAIDQYDNTVAKIIRDRVSVTEQKITGLTSTVSDVESTFAGNIQSLSNQVSQLIQDSTQFKTTVSATYTTKEETTQAKNDAINSANANTANQLKNYSTTAQMNSAIDQKADSITTTVSTTYATKEETTQAKNDAISSANANTANQLKNYSTTAQMNSAIDQKANSITTTVSTTYATKTDLNTKFETATSQFTQLSDKFSWVVKSGTSASNFELTDRTATLIANQINLKGLVTFSGLNSETQNKITAAQTTATNAWNWVNSNGSNMTNLRAMILKWTNNAVTTSTYIQGGWIATNTITAEKLAIGDFTNYAQLNSLTASTYGWTSVTDSSASNNPWFQRTTVNRDNAISRSYTCNGGESFRVKADISTTVKGATTSGGSTIAGLQVRIGLYTVNSDGSRSYMFSSGVKNSTGTISSVVTLPTNARSFIVHVQCEGWAPLSGTLKVRNVQVTRMAAGELIVDGSITAEKITTENIVGTNGWINLRSGTFNYGNGKLVWDGSNLSVSGKITATTGTIGGFTIGSSYLANGTTSLGNGSSSVFVGTNGISCGTKFKVTNAGAVTSSSISMTGTFSAKSSNDEVRITPGNFSFYRKNAKKMELIGYEDSTYDSAILRITGSYATMTLTGDSIEFNGKNGRYHSYMQGSASGVSMAVTDLDVSGRVTADTLKGGLITRSGSNRFFIDWRTGSDGQWHLYFYIDNQQIYEW